jgi:Dolichyl-phosphate-mannose-protein mannosyltransferase
MRHVGRAFGRAPSDVYLGGIVVSWVAFAIAMIGLYYVARLDLSARRAGRAVMLAAVFPFAFFYGAVYTEATFLAATVWTFYFFRTRRWLLGGLCGAIATATRVNGIMMWPALAWIVWREVWQQRPERDPVEARRDQVLSIAGLLLVGAGIASYSLFIYQLSGHPFEWAATVQRWGYHPGGSPWMALVRLVTVLVTRPYSYLAAETMAPYDTLNGLTALAFVIAIPFIWYRLGTAYGLFITANLWLPLSSGQFEGVGRYCSVLFPFFILIGSIRSRAFFTGALLVSAMLYAFCLALFTNIHPLF